jgi:hypothetical protein
MVNFMDINQVKKNRKYRRIGTFSQGKHGVQVGIDPAAIKELNGDYELCIVENQNAHIVYRGNVKGTE